MPIESSIPVLDNRRFDDILAEIRTRIPRYTPEWTDLNDSDPGITIAQLLAWLSEMLLFRMGRVPELNYLKFLQLVGLELLPAEPARAEITFPVLPSATVPYIIVPPQTPVSAESTDGGPPVVFETERALWALRARLAALQIADGYSFTDITAINEEAEAGFNPLGPLASAGSALMLGFDLDDLFPQIELNLTVWAFEGSVTGASVDCSLPDTPTFSSSRISWEYWNGFEWRTLSLLKDETQTFLRSGHIYFKTPAKGEMVKASLGVIAQSLYWIRGRVVRSDFDRLPRLLAIRTNTVEAVQAETIPNEVLGGSNGEPNQVFRLANTPVLHDTLVLEIDEGAGFEEWRRVDDFFAFGKADRVYVLNRTTGEVRMGDGTNGAIPVGNPDNPNSNVVARTYRFGGGKRGNAAAGAIKTPLISFPGLDDSKIANLQPAFGGRNEEALGEAKLRAPATLRSRSRAVTAEDFEELAKQSSNVKRAKALPLHHPSFPGVNVPGVVTVIVVPDNDNPNPMPSQGTLRSVCAYLNQRRLLTTELYVVPPTYRLAEVHAEIVAENTADAAQVKEDVEESLLSYFHPLKGGDNGLGWPFGGDIFFSRVYQRILAVPGVQRIERATVVVDGEEAPECTNVTIAPGELVYSVLHDVLVEYAQEE